MVVEEKTDTVENVIKDIIIDVFKIRISPSEIKSSTNLYDFGLDSFNVVNLLIGIEDKLGVTVEPENISADTFEKFENLLGLIVRRAT